MRRLRCLLPFFCLLIPLLSKAEPGRLPQPDEVVSMARIESILRERGLDSLWRHIERYPPPRVFRSDGCTSWPDQWVDHRLRVHSLYEGCFIHDLFYWSGLPGDDMARLRADVWLMLWVAERVSIPLGETMFNGVRIGGSEHVQTPWRWGFGRND